MGKISAYNSSVVLHDNDLFDKSNTNDNGVSYNESQKVTWAQLKTAIQALPTSNFATNDLVFTSDRTHNLAGFNLELNNGNVGFGTTADLSTVKIESLFGLSALIVDDSSGSLIFGVSDLGETVINGKLEVTQENYSDGSTTLDSFIANNRGYVFQTNRNAAVNWNDYNNQVGASTAQTWKSHFTDYEINPAKFEGSTNKPHIHAQHRSQNSLAFSKVGINARNETDNILLYVELDKFGENAVTNPTIQQLFDDFGDYTINSDLSPIKTGLDIKLGGDGNVYENTGAGDAIHKCLTLSAESADINIALQTLNGLVIFENIPTSASGLPTGAIYKMGTNLHIV